MALPMLLVTSQPARAQSAEDLTGRWAKLTRLESLSKVPVLGEISLETEVISLVEFRPNGDDGVLYREKTCSLRSNTLAGLVKTSYPKALLRVITKPWTPAKVRVEGGQLVLDVPKAYKAYGYHPKTPGQTPPRDVKDGRVYDQDRDGHPGITVETSGIVSGELYAALLEWNASEGRMVSPRRIDGQVRWGTDLAVLGASTGLLENQAPTRPKPDPTAHRYVMKRVPSNATCGQLLARADSVFGDALAMSD